MGPESSDEEAEGSKLGRKDHWDSTYALELENLEELGDEGEIWFGEDVMETMVGWTAELLHRERPSQPLDAALLDVGTGNGVLPLSLVQLGFTNISGSDYSEAAIQLAQAVAKKRGVDSVRWIVDDLLHTRITDRFDVITDKGTFDAVGLMQDAAASRQLYTSAVSNVLKPGGLLVITSCNTTRDELVEQFCSDQGSSQDSERANGVNGSSRDQQDSAAGEHASEVGRRGFKYVDHVRTYPVFRFGGVEGSKVCTVAFRRL